MTTISDIMDTFESYGYSVMKEMMPNLAWAVEQSFNKVKNPTSKEDLTIRFTWPREYIGDNSKNFTIFEQESGSFNGQHFGSPGHVYYFYSFDFDMSGKMYRDDDLDSLLKDCYNEVISRMGVDGLRNIKLTNLGI